MKIAPITKREDLQNSPKLNTAIAQFEKLITALNELELSNTTVETINAHIAQINTSTNTGNSLKRLLLKKQMVITKILEKEHKIVTKNYYRNLWLVLGMSAFGLPLGVAFGLSIGNIGLMGVGLPIGMAIGIAVGTAMDKKAAKEGRQINIEL